MTPTTFVISLLIYGQVAVAKCHPPLVHNNTAAATHVCVCVAAAVVCARGGGVMPSHHTDLPLCSASTRVCVLLQCVGQSG